ncbi:MAG: isoprenyl transferase [Candidatus Omnitrophota bacterium]
MLDKNNIPNHVAIILDGNGRWAKQRRLPRTAGHQRGIKRIRETIEAASDLGINIITLFVFSTENWQRPKMEVNMLMHAFLNFLNNEIKELHKNNLRFRVIGRHDNLSEKLLTKINQAEKLTASNTGMTVVLALNYGGRAEIVDAAKKFARKVRAGDYQINQLNEKTFSDFLYAPNLPEPDLFIRTSGELRLSNFLIWQLAYSELYFIDKHWPDFNKHDLTAAIVQYQKRQRRFGSL